MARHAHTRRACKRSRPGLTGAVMPPLPREHRVDEMRYTAEVHLEMQRVACAGAASDRGHAHASCTEGLTSKRRKE